MSEGLKENTASKKVSLLNISQATTTIFNDLYIQKTFLFFIQKGSKRVIESDGSDIICNEGDVLLCAPGSFVSMQNRPRLDVDYRAVGLSFTDDLVNRVFNKDKISENHKPIQLIRNQEHPSKAILDVILETIDNQASLPIEIVESRLVEPLVWVKMNGFYVRRPEKQIFDKVRQLIGTHITHSWNSQNVSKHLAMSEATMRRQLAKSGYKFSTILLNTRLEKGLILLQTTNLKIIEIAYECGFKSPSHFSETFNKRFGTPPKSIRLSSK